MARLRFNIRPWLPLLATPLLNADKKHVLHEVHCIQEPIQHRLLEGARFFKEQCYKIQPYKILHLWHFCG